MIQNDLNEGQISFTAIYGVYIAGKLKIEELTPMIVALLANEEHDILREEACDALVKIGTDQAVLELEKIALETTKNTFLYAIDVLANIKTKTAEQVLLRLFEQAKDITFKTLIADGLCRQLSTAAIPKVAAMVEAGYDETLLELEESIYACCTITTTPHPKMSEWKQALIELDARIEQMEKEMTQNLISTEKVGRNEPCPCGSGKKYKKCCGA
ncbi:hypothetical protein EJF36_12850 [Bacillus sp. HMF5848]|nr:hypothetical protein EJF36_12850 [Bacillus sp. HMF5848]